MYDRLLTLIRVDLTIHEATISIRGRLTTTNYRALLPLIKRAHALPGNPVVIIDLAPAASVDPHANRLLVEACHSAALHAVSGSVRIVGNGMADATMPTAA